MAEGEAHKLADMVADAAHAYFDVCNVDALSVYSDIDSDDRGRFVQLDVRIYFEGNEKDGGL